MAIQVISTVNSTTQALVPKWEDTKTYSTGKLVAYNDKLYVSIRNSNPTYPNVGRTPGTNASNLNSSNEEVTVEVTTIVDEQEVTTQESLNDSIYWRVIESPGKYRGSYDKLKVYVNGDIVQYTDGNMYLFVVNTGFPSVLPGNNSWWKPFYVLPSATSSVRGGVKVSAGNGLAYSSNIISMSLASGTTAGTCKQGTGTTISNGAINVSFATSANIANNLTSDVMAVTPKALTTYIDTLNLSSSSDLSAGDGIAISNDYININLATNGGLAFESVTENDVTVKKLKATPATTSIAGVVTLGSCEGIPTDNGKVPVLDASGLLSEDILPNASDSSYGAIKFSDLYNNSTVTNYFAERATSSGNNTKTISSNGIKLSNIPTTNNTLPNYYYAISPSACRTSTDLFKIVFNPTLESNSSNLKKWDTVYNATTKTITTHEIIVCVSPLASGSTYSKTINFKIVDNATNNNEYPFMGEKPTVLERDIGVGYLYFFVARNCPFYTNATTVVRKWVFNFQGRVQFTT